MADYDTYMAKARELAAEGRTEEAKRLAQIALKARGEVDKPINTRVREFLLGDNDPTTQNLGEKIGTFLNKSGEALTFGLIGDEASAAVESVLPGVDYETRRDHYRNQEALLDESNPGAALAADLGGAVTGAAVPVLGAIGTLGRGAGLVPRVAASSAAGAGMGATSGFMEGEGSLDRLENAKAYGLLGAGVGAAAPVFGAGIQKIADGAAARRAIRHAAQGARTPAEEMAAAKAMYGAIDDSGVAVAPEAFGRLNQNMRQGLAGLGLDDLPGPGSLTPKAARVAEISKQMADQAADTGVSVPFASIDQLRRHAGTAASDTASFTGRATTDSRLGVEAIEQVDDFIRNLSDADVSVGDVKTLQTLIPKARETYARASRSQLLDEAIDAGTSNYLSGGASGIRNQFKRILNNPKLSRGFSDAERKVMSRVAKGTLPEQLLYMISGGVGNLATVGVGMSMGPVGALAGGAAAMGLRKGAEAIASRNAELARAVVSNGGLSQLPVASTAARGLAEGLIRRAVTAQ